MVMPQPLNASAIVSGRRAALHFRVEVNAEAKGLPRGDVPLGTALPGGMVRPPSTAPCFPPYRLRRKATSLLCRT
jgi:hypothetical protein